MRHKSRYGASIAKKNVGDRPEFECHLLQSQPFEKPERKFDVLSKGQRRSLPPSNRLTLQPVP